MSRRGRGGFGGRSKNGTTRIAGIEVAYDEGIDEVLKGRVQPAKLFPVCSASIVSRLPCRTA